jgi:hypothetical protein
MSRRYDAPVAADADARGLPEVGHDATAVDASAPEPAAVSTYDTGMEPGCIRHCDLDLPRRGQRPPLGILRRALQPTTARSWNSSSVRAPAYVQLDRSPAMISSITSSTEGRSAA